jgi:NIMA (never in mitosis gene a)-related kinase
VSRASAKEKSEAVKEATLLSSLNHPYIVRYRDSFFTEGWLCIIMDFCEGGDLSSKIKRARENGKPLSEDEVLRLLTQALLALKHIHDKHILHRDLKPGNFFLSSSGALKMGDFGLAKVLHGTMAFARTRIGTPVYSSPEFCQGQPYAWPSDIWAMGCILYELCALKLAFDPGQQRSPAPQVPARYSDFVRGLCAEMLNKDPKRRPTAENILQRPMIRAVVRQMSGTPGAASPAPQRPDSYKKGDLVSYHSSTHQAWLPAKINNIDSKGSIRIDLKPGTWISKEEQSRKIRPRRG